MNAFALTYNVYVIDIHIIGMHVSARNVNACMNEEVYV